jgi:nicotinamide-nucleotide amidase
MTEVFADIITIGDELLIGQVVDTNSAYIASELTKIGVTVRRIISIADQATSITNTLDESIHQSDITIITGGLGPTGDDITKQSLATYFGGGLILHPETLKEIEQFFTKRGAKMTDRNRKQAEIPDMCTPLRNRIGTAPGLLFRKDNRTIIALPGVPFEMKALILEDVVPVILSNFNLPVKLSITILTAGLSESMTADLLEEWESNLPSEYTFAYLPSIGILRLRLSISGKNEDNLKRQLKYEANKLVQILGKKHVFGFDDDTLPSVIGNKLKNINCTLSVAESCTGGYIAHQITSIPGSSAYFMGSATTYANSAKSQLLQVSDEDIVSQGAVSKKVVEQMAIGAQQLFGSDFSVATSGIAGPDGGTDEKPVGTTWIAVTTPHRIISQLFFFGDSRERNIIRASVTALNMLRISIDEYSKK